MLHETRRRAGPAFALLAALAFASLACAAAQSGVAAGKTLAKGAAPPVPAWLEDPLQILGVRQIAHLEQGVLVPLRDGTQLMATLVVPDGASASSRRPAILDQSPYVPQQELRMGRAVFSRLVRKGYVIVVVNDRGTQWSGGEYHWVKNATNDGVDVVAWITSQPWSSRAVGAWGCSSSGEVEFSLARASPPGLKAAVPMAAATGIGVIPGFADQGIFYTGGVPSFDWAWWYHGNGYWHHPKLPPGLPARERVALIQQFNPEAYAASSEDLTWAAHLPAEDVLSAIGSPETEFNELIRLAPGDPAWKEYDFLNDGDRTRVPMLLVDTWYDTIEAYGTTKAFQYLSSNSPNQYLIMGAGPHCTMGYETKQTMVGGRPVGDARFDYAGTVVRWFDHWLADGGRGKLDMPRVQYYPLASNHWESAGSWPPPSSPTKLYLYSQGHANSLSGDGQLLWHAGSGAADSFFDDPMRPVPTNGGGCCDRNVSRDQTAIERLRYRNGIEKPALMRPGRTYRVVLREMVVASRFAPGHRLRIEIAGTNFPEYERNLNTAGPSFNETRAVVAHDSIYHDPGHRSFFELPVVHDPR